MHVLSFSAVHTDLLLKNGLVTKPNILLGSLDDRPHAARNLTVHLTFERAALPHHCIHSGDKLVREVALESTWHGRYRLCRAIAWSALRGLTEICFIFLPTAPSEAGSVRFLGTLQQSA